MGHCRADVERELLAVVFDVVGGEGAEEFEELGADAVAAVEKEGEETWEEDACW